MSTQRPEALVFYSIEPSDESISRVCDRFSITKESEEFREALAAVLNADMNNKRPDEPDFSLGHLLETEALLEMQTASL